jgi:glucose-6-phosphate isomerase
MGGTKIMTHATPRNDHPFHAQAAGLHREAEVQIEAALRHLEQEDLIGRIWLKDHTVWKDDPAEISNRLGWLTVAESMAAEVADLTRLAVEIRDAGFRDVVLLGMGGSSLAPELLQAGFGPQEGYPRLQVLDSTVPAWVRRVEEAIDPAQTLFIVSSKSGGTVETMTLYHYFAGAVKEAKGTRAGENFIAITDGGSSLEKLAREQDFRRLFLNDPDVGGRYSALSFFGLVPAALAGLDVATLLERGLQMAEACAGSIAPRANPGAWLGAAVAGLALAGRDKITFIPSPSLETFGLWAEQLIAESSGKEGKGILPIAREPISDPQVYGDDRIFIYLHLAQDDNEAGDQHVATLIAAGQPVIQINMRDRYDLAAEFFRWEFATAVACAFLGVNPFDQPNVQEAKRRTTAVLEELKETGRLPALLDTGELPDFLEQAQRTDYLAIMAYLDGDPGVDAALQEVRAQILERYYLANTMGYGPRFLHSTGQLHKGGPGNGLFLQLVADYSDDLPVPGSDFTFAGLVSAQAAGDYEALESRGRRVLRLNLGSDVVMALNELLGGGE